MTQYTSVTDSDLAAMLATIGVSSVQEIFDRQIPQDVRLGRPLELPDGQSEQDVYEHLRALAARNISAEDELCFLGAGMYDHYVPAIVDMLMERSEFLTPYTPYQPEISQGGLQVMFEYQTAICELTGLPVANASVYEGPSAVASAGYLAKLHNGRTRFVVSAGLHPHTLATLRTYAHGYGIEVVEVPLADGLTDPEAWASAIDRTRARRSSPSPTSMAPSRMPPRCLPPRRKLEASSSSRSPRWTRSCSASSPRPESAAWTSPWERASRSATVSTSVALRLASSLRARAICGGCRDVSRERPRDVDGRRGFVLTLQTREQHIRREKATSNICTSQALNAFAGVVYLSWLGRQGFVELGELCSGAPTMRARPCARSMAWLSFTPSRWCASLPCASARMWRPCVAVAPSRASTPAPTCMRCTGREQDRGGLLVAITERRSRADIDRLATCWARPSRRAAGKRRCGRQVEESVTV